MMKTILGPDHLHPLDASKIGVTFLTDRNGRFQRAGWLGAISVKREGRAFLGHQFG